MIASQTVLFAILSFGLVAPSLAIPVSSLHSSNNLVARALPAPDLLANGQDAQNQNAQFAALNASDSSNSRTSPYGSERKRERFLSDSLVAHSIEPGTPSPGQGHSLE